MRGENHRLTPGAGDDRRHITKHNRARGCLPLEGIAEWVQPDGLEPRLQVGRRPFGPMRPRDAGAEGHDVAHLGQRGFT